MCLLQIPQCAHTCDLTPNGLKIQQLGHDLVMHTKVQSRYHLICVYMPACVCVYVCVCVCVCVWLCLCACMWDRQRDRQTDRVYMHMHEFKNMYLGGGMSEVTAEQTQPSALNCSSSAGQSSSTPYPMTLPPSPITLPHPPGERAGC